MASAQPESKPASTRGSSAETSKEEEGRVGTQKAAGAVSVGSHEGVNSRPRGTSNSKEQRAREAEEDRALIAKAQAGDTAAFRTLVERHQRRAFAIAYSLVRDEHDARELVQDAFLRVFKGLGTFQGGSSFFTWLYRIVTNLSIDLMRKPGRVAAGSGTGGLGERMDAADAGGDHEADAGDFPLLSRIDGSDPVDVLRRREIAARIQTALDALPAYHRSVIVMREVEGLSYDEMAQVMGVSKGTIMSRLFHARQKLQRALVDCYEEQVGGAPTKGAVTKDAESPPPSPNHETEHETEDAGGPASDARDEGETS
jgi:RNA polymerase sigma-70 factor, ECF subfamily